MQSFQLTCRESIFIVIIFAITNKTLIEILKFCYKNSLKVVKEQTKTLRLLQLRIGITVQ